MDASRIAFARGLLVGALVLAVALNLVQFMPIEARMGGNYAAFNRYEASDLVSIVPELGPTSQARFTLYTQLRHWTDAAEVSVDPRVRIHHAELLGLSGVVEITSHDEEIVLSEEQRAYLDAHVVASGDDQRTGPFVIAVADPDTRGLVAFPDGDRVLFADVRLLEGAGS